MLQSVDTGTRSLESYRGIIIDETLEELYRLSKDLRGLRVLHLNATPYGGGVAELLRSVVPLLNNLGLLTDWKIISGDNKFFKGTKTIHNALQGAKHVLAEEDQSLFIETNKQNAKRLEEEYDIVVIHDPQPAPIPALRGKGSARWVWRCHIDTSNHNLEVWSFLKPWLEVYDAAIFTLEEFITPDFPLNQIEVIPPAIDPLSPKNFTLPDTITRQVLEWIGLQLDSPFITQVSRFDPWKDPMGVIEAYRLVRKDIPNLQLALVGSMALDDPESWEIYQKIRRESEQDSLIHVFTNLTGIGNIEVNAFQRLSNVIVQKSIREGFGLVVSEALWKGTPVVAGKTGGIPLQMADGVGGYLVESIEECAEAILNLLKKSAATAEITETGKERVRRHFLLPRLLLNEVSLIHRLVAGRPLIRQMWESWRDPVCGMAVSDQTPANTTQFADRTYVFCSKACHTRFLRHPEHYVRQ
jgi:trehalose synthase